MRIRIVTFGLNIPAEAYTAHAVHIDPRFASQRDSDRSRATDLFQRMFINPALKDVTVREYDVLTPPTAITASTSLLPSALQEAR